VKTFLIAIFLATVFVEFALAQTISVREQPRRADDFVESIGVVTHHNYLDRPYNDWSLVKQRLQEIGIRYVRDSVDMPDRLNELEALGIGVVGLVDRRKYFGSVPLQLDFKLFDDYISRAKRVRPLIALESANEYDALRDKLDWKTEVVDWTRRLRESMNQDSRLRTLPLLHPSLIWKESSDQLGNVLTPVVDAGNSHAYPGGNKPGHQLEYYLSFARANAGAGKPIYVTETGYHYSLSDPRDFLQPGVPEDVGAKYTLRNYAEFFKAGAYKTFNYELLSECTDENDGECRYGLLNEKLDYRAAGTALKNLIALLAERGKNRFTPNDLAFSLSGSTADIKTLLLQKSNGNNYVLIWADKSLYKQRYLGREVVASQNLSMSVGNNYRDALIHTFDDRGNLNTVRRGIDNGQLALSVDAAIQVVALEASTEVGPDLVVTEISTDPANPSPGDPVVLSAVIKNVGATATPNGVIHGVRFDVNGKTVAWSTSYRSSLGAGQSVRVVAEGGPNGERFWRPTSGTFLIRAEVDDVNRIANESNESNNVSFREMRIGASSNALAGVYRISAPHSGKVVDVSSVSNDDGAVIHQWTNFDQANQKWRVEAQSDGSYRLLALHSNKALDLQSANTADGTPIWQYAWNGSCAQRWYIEPRNANVYSIRSTCANKVIEVESGRTDDGAPLRLVTPNGASHQVFSFERVGD
jgi:hypothetical protein